MEGLVPSGELGRGEAGEDSLSGAGGAGEWEEGPGQGWQGAGSWRGALAECCDWVRARDWLSCGRGRKQTVFPETPCGSPGPLLYGFLGI